MMGIMASVKNAVKKAFSYLSQFAGVMMVRASGPEDKRNAVHTIEGAVIGGAIMFLAKPVAIWLTGINPANPPSNLPAELITMVNNLLSLFQYLGAVILIAGFIYGGIKWSMKKHANKK
jgi:hypothetical protein